jgi:uncharacterized membrane protein
MLGRGRWSFAGLVLLLSALAATSIGSGAAPAPAYAQSAFEQIDAYRVDIRIEPDGALLITEDIHYDFGDEERHGIFRDIPTRLRYDDEQDRVYPLDVESVTGSPGTPAQYEVEGGPGGITRIRIGDPDRTISGQHSYQIVYRVESALNGFPDHDELYWNAIGTDWAAPISSSEVTVHVPGESSADIEIACFAGPDGSQLACDAARVEGQQATFSNGLLGSFEGLTVVVGFPKGLVPEPVPVLETRRSLQRAFTVDALRLGAAGALLAAVIAGLVWLVWRQGRDVRWRGSPVEVVFGGKQGQQRVPLFEGGAYAIEYTPPDDLRPGQVGTLLDETAHPLDVSATIVDLATRGYLRIEEIPKTWWFGKSDWNLVRLPAPERDKRELLRYEELLLDGLFEDGEEVKLSSLKRKFYKRMDKVQDALYSDAVKRGWFKRSPEKTRGFWTAVAVGALIASIALVVAAAKWTTFAIVPIPLVLGALLLLMLRGRMPRRTAKGTAALRRTLGFREFIETAETRRAEFAEKAVLFYEYLPFAIVFGCVDRWADAFEGLALPEASWYSSTHAFSAVAFADTMDGFSTTSSGTLVSTPGGSGGSGFSGGSSGGGGGGGGGGSW